MKKILRWLGYIALVPLVLILILFITSWLFRDKIADKVLEEINQQVEAEVGFDSYQLSPLRHFPDMSFKLNGLRVVGREAFAEDTLVQIESLDIEVDLWSLIRPPFRVESVGIDRAKVLTKVLKDGSVNWSIIKMDENTISENEPEKEEESLQLDIRKVLIRDSRVKYVDAESDIYTDLKSVDARFSNSGDDSLWESTILVSDWDLGMEGMHLMQEMNASLKAMLAMDITDWKLVIDSGKLKMNAMPFALDGFMAMPDSSILMDLDFSSDHSTFKDLLSLIPAVYQGEFNDLKASGAVLLSGSVEGSYDAHHFPRTDLSFTVSNGEFSYPDLPKSVSGVFLNLGIQNTDGTVDGTVIDLARFNAKLGEDPIDLAFYMEDPVSNPLIKTRMNALLDLASWREFIPLDQGDQLSGKVSADIQYQGRLADAKQKRFDRIKASGSLSGRDVNYKGALVDQKINIEKMALHLKPERIWLEGMDMKAGESDLALNGSLQNYLPWFFNQDNLEAELNLSSEYLDLNEWMNDQTEKEVAKTSVDSTSASLPEIPQNLSAKLQLTIGELKYDKYELKDVRGKLRIQDGVAYMDPVRFETLGGKMEMKGNYRSPKGESEPAVDLDVELKDMALAQTVQTFNTIQRLAPLAARCTGNYSAGLKIKGNLKDGFSPDLSTLNGLLSFRTEKLQVDQTELVAQIGQLTGSNYFDSPTLSKVNAFIEFKDGLVELKPFTTKVKEAKLEIGGKQGLNGSLDYNIGVDIPSKELQFEKTKVAQQLFDLPLAKAANLTWPERVRLDISVGGTLKKPSLSLNVKDQFKNLKEEVVEKVKDKAKEEFEKRRAELVYKAEVQANLLLEEANKKGDQLVNEARKQAEKLQYQTYEQIDRLKSEADKKADELITKAGANPIKKLAAQEAAQLIKSEAQKKADQLKNETQKQVNKLEDEAENRKQDLVDKAKQEGADLIEQAKNREL